MKKEACIPERMARRVFVPASGGIRTGGFFLKAADKKKLNGFRACQHLFRNRVAVRKV